MNNITDSDYDVVKLRKGKEAWKATHSGLGHLHVVASFHMRIPMHGTRTMTLSFKTVPIRELDNDWVDVIFNKNSKYIILIKIIH